MAGGESTKVNSFWKLLLYLLSSSSLRELFDIVSLSAMKMDLTMDIITRKFIPAEVGKILRKHALNQERKWESRKNDNGQEKRKENTLSAKKESKNQEKRRK